MILAILRHEEMYSIPELTEERGQEVDVEKRSVSEDVWAADAHRGNEVAVDETRWQSEGAGIVVFVRSVDEI